MRAYLATLEKEQEEDETTTDSQTTNIDKDSKSDTILKKVKFIHFVKDNEFEEIESFRTQIETMCGIKVQLYSSDFKREVQRVIDEEGVKAIIMGNRRTDPWSANLEPITKSSEGWPDFMRIFPIINWEY